MLIDAKQPKMPSVNEQPTQSVEMTAQADGVETQQPVSLGLLGVTFFISADSLKN